MDSASLAAAEVASAAEPAAILHAMPFKPDVTVAAIAATNGRFLLVEERITHRLVFNLPAGHVEDGETLIDAVVREVREETAWLFHTEALLGIYLWRRPGNGRSTLRFTFTGSVTDHRRSPPLDRGIVRTHWLSQEEMRQREARMRSPLVLRCLDDFLAGNRLPLSAVAYLDLETATDLRAVSV